MNNDAQGRKKVNMNKFGKRNMRKLKNKIQNIKQIQEVKLKQDL